MPLEKELETYRSKLPELHDEQGKFALVHGDTVAGIYGTYDDALKAGYEKFSLEPFLVKQIQIVEQVQFISRFTGPECRTSPSL